MNTQKHDCKTELREVELRVTPARLGVLAALEHADKPLDVTTLISYLKNHNIRADRVTVFRIVNALAEKGLVKPIQFNEGRLRYEPASLPEHHHFVCEKCGKVEIIENCLIHSIEKNLQKKKGLLIKRHCLEFFGLCARCQN